ncbi:MAG TPA: hypothetical protein VHX37_00725 [Acidobacteriaceae bacterium]|jgi:hypothetical protein|nr:hypothetical protein [Acidobacteriaceae bacterium]
MTRSALATPLAALLSTALLSAAVPSAALLLAASQTTPPSLSAQNPPTERSESGQVESPTGAIHYRIRLLPLASFPLLPPAVAAQLSRRQCMIPQSFEAHQPENVIHGAFRAPGSSDWAVLCSVSGSTTLYVFLEGELDAPISLRTQPDTTWLGAEPDSSLHGSAWGISTLPVEQLRSSPQLRNAAALDHDAIDDAHLEHSAAFRYHQSGKWLVLNPSGGNEP